MTLHLVPLPSSVVAGPAFEAWRLEHYAAWRATVPAGAERTLWYRVEHEPGCPLEDTDDLFWHQLSTERRATCTCASVTVTPHVGGGP